MKPLLFQLIHTLSVIQKEHPEFRHNSLNPSNVFLYLRDNDSNVTEYSFGNKKYYLTGNNFDIKITNFSKSNIPKYNKLVLKGIPFLNKKNRYFDLHYFLNTLLYKSKFDYCDNDTKNFLLEIIPEKYRGKGKNNFYLEKNVELFVPEKLLKHKYFTDLLIKKKNLEIFSPHNYYVGSHKSNSSFKGSRKLNRNNKNKINKSDKLVRKIVQ